MSDDTTRTTNDGLTRRQALGRTAAGLAGLVALLLPGAAAAHGRGRRRRRQRHDDHRSRHGFGHGGGRHGYAGGGGGYGYGATQIFFCAPCGHRFHRRVDFHSHLHHQHHIPFWQIPSLIVQAAFGWIFYGH